MENALNKLNYAVNRQGNGTSLDVFVIDNPDGSPRWIFPANAKKPLFLKFYHIEGTRSRIFALLSRFLFILGLQSFMYRKETFYITPKVPANELLIDVMNDAWALFTGTKGPNNKMVLYSECKSGSRFLKIPSTDQASRIVEQENIGCQKVTAISPESFRVPNINAHDNGILEIEDIGIHGKRCNTFSNPHQHALCELYSKTAYMEAPGNATCLTEGRKHLSNASLGSDSRIPKNLIAKLNDLDKELNGISIMCALGHGDFTPWNMFLKKDNIAIYDWELADDTYPLAFDAFHFVIQKGIMLEQKSWRDIRKELNADVAPWLRALLSGTETEWEQYLKLYLFVNITKHLDIYMKQENWHDQVHWLMATWNEALSDITAKPTNGRAILIDDVFFMLRDKDYATIKFPDIQPRTLSAYSDIDICLQKKDSKKLVNQLKNHPLVEKVILNKRSFMWQVQLILGNNEILNLDLIWQLKWKNLEMMDVKTVLERTQPNAYGIKAMHPFYLKMYLGFFYGLNNARTPAKYDSFIRRDTGRHNVTNTLIETAHKEGRIPKKELIMAVKKQTTNKGLYALKNKLAYVFDTVYSMFNRKGIIITFSGVDGAGKSTIIEQIRYEYEKKLRRKVVVLRHRPSILPILSAWTKGKAKAEQDSAETLPRQGTNKSVLSSLIRFSYYYTDYLLGQFIIYVRYVLRGDIVLYDRYYFDFINDSVRSNIRLPESFLRAGYVFLKKPDFNFFLYADADTILARKQELDRDTIKNLTRKYLDLFQSLGRSKKSSHRYIAIENKDLKDTINQIVRTTTGKAA